MKKNDRTSGALTHRPPERYICDYKNFIFKQISLDYPVKLHSAEWHVPDITEDKLLLVQLMALCLQVTKGPSQ